MIQMIHLLQIQETGFQNSTISNDFERLQNERQSEFQTIQKKINNFKKYFKDKL